MARIGAMVPDLLLASKVAETLGSAGHEVVPVNEPGDELAGIDLLVVDVGEVDAAAVAGRGMPVLGFYRHTEPAVREHAEGAGVELVVPRSRLAREMPQLVQRLLEQAGAGGPEG